jgi:pterin-4a-carbinolamine dehydratase
MKANPMKPKCDKLDWSVDITGERITASMSFKDFEQSQRFVALIIKFIKDERAPPQILEDVAWYFPPTDTGRMT